MNIFYFKLSRYVTVCDDNQIICYIILFYFNVIIMEDTLLLQVPTVDILYCKTKLFLIYQFDLSGIHHYNTYVYVVHIICMKSIHVVQFPKTLTHYGSLDKIFIDPKLFSLNLRVVFVIFKVEWLSQNFYI